MRFSKNRKGCPVFLETRTFPHLQYRNSRRLKFRNPDDPGSAKNIDGFLKERTHLQFFMEIHFWLLTVLQHFYYLPRLPQKIHIGCIFGWPLHNKTAILGSAHSGRNYYLKLYNRYRKTIIRPFLIGTVKYEFWVFRFQKLVLCSPYTV